MKLAVHPRPAPAAAPEEVSVDGVVIPREAIAREAQHHPAASSHAAYAAAARALVIRELLLGEARRLGVVATPGTDEGGRRETDEDAIVGALIAREAPTPEPDEAACRRYFEANRRRFRSADLWEPEHILFAATADDAAARERALAQARAAIRALADSPERFGALARELSACSSAAEGGRLGQIARGEIEPSFEAALAALASGEIAAEPVETRHGVHVVRLGRRIPGADLPFEAVRERIATYLDEAVSRRAAAQYIAVLAGRADIIGVAIDAARSPLLQ